VHVEDEAEIPIPIDDDGVRSVAVGTALFAVASAITPFVADAEVAWTCLSGFLLGLLGVYYCVRRRNAIARDAATATG
jgi:hypothetical protein